MLPTVVALALLAPVRTPKPLGSAAAGVPPSGRPHRVMWADSCRNIISRKPPAARMKTTHETPFPMTLIGTQYTASRGSPASGTRRSQQARMSTTSRASAPHGIRSGAMLGTLTGSGGR